MSRTNRVLIISVLLSAGCAKVSFQGPMTRASLAGDPPVVREQSFALELQSLHKEVMTIGRGLNDGYGLSILEAAGHSFWTRELDWSDFNDADRAMIGLMLDRIEAIAKRRREITGSSRAFEDTAPTDRARVLNKSLKKFEEQHFERFIL